MHNILIMCHLGFCEEEKGLLRSNNQEKRQAVLKFVNRVKQENNELGNPLFINIQKMTDLAILIGLFGSLS